MIYLSHMKKKLLLFAICTTLLSGCDFKNFSIKNILASLGIGERIDDGPELESILLSLDTLTIKVGETYTLEASFKPTGVMWEGLTWRSDNTSVATVNNGVVTAINAGSAKIFAEVSGKSAYCEVTVTKQSEEEEEQKEDLQEYTATLETHGLYFNTNFSEGTNLTSASQSKVDELREYLEDPLEYENLFTSLTCEYCTTRKVDGDTYLQIGTGSYAKGKFNEGTFKYGSKEKIYRVEVTAFNYSNPYQDYSTGALVPNVDTEAHLLLDDNDLSLELPSTSNPVEKSVVKEYANGVNSFTLKATNGRVLIKSITITWRG